MPKANSLAGLLAASLLFAAPALADGRDRAPSVGPAPLQAQPCPHGTLQDGACYMPQRTETRIIRRAPATVHASRAASAAPAYDFSGFTGGVGANVGMGFVGGGGRSNIIILNAPPRFSGIRHSAVGQVSLAGN